MDTWGIIVVVVCVLVMLGIGAFSVWASNNPATKDDLNDEYMDAIK